MAFNIFAMFLALQRIMLLLVILIEVSRARPDPVVDREDSSSSTEDDGKEEEANSFPLISNTNVEEEVNDTTTEDTPGIRLESASATQLN